MIPTFLLLGLKRLSTLAAISVTTTNSNYRTWRTKPVWGGTHV